jgi:phosphopantetheinyl transferase (holo-ACP synthase)
VETVALHEVALNREAIEASCFDPQESPATLALRTFAGFLCVKKAVASAARFTGNNTDCREKDVLVGHDGLGAPRILTMPGTVRDRLGKIRVSVSHTADHACGCAVIEEDATHA